MIYQVFHKPELFTSCDPADPHGQPIAVGEAAAWGRERATLTDAAGHDHLNHLNDRLNEWTAIYWVWRHLADLADPHEWIGFSHYRRPAPAFMRADAGVVDGLLTEFDVLSWIPNFSALEKQA